LLLEGKKKVSTPKKLPDDVSNSLTNSVHQLAMNDPHPNLSASAFTGVGERVSGLNSFFYSGGRSTSDSAEGNKALTMSEKLQAARKARARGVHDKRAGGKSPSPIKDIAKQKKAKTRCTSAVLEAIHKLQHGEAPSVEQKLKETERLAGDDLGVDQMKEDVRDTDQEVPGNLTGAHDEPRQEP